MARPQRPILIVEDDADIRNILCEELRSEGYELVAVDAGDRGLDVLARDPRRWLVLLDLSLPRLDGFQFLNAVETMALPDDALRILILSALAPDEGLLRRRFVRAFLRKPFRFTELISAVRAAAHDSPSP